jgi:hypothetical protein
MLARFEEPTADAPSRPAEEAYRELDRKVTAAGAKLILVVFPNFAPNRRIFDGKPEDVAPAVFCFDRPAAFPKLYEPDYRENQTHLNDRGAREFTQALARRFAAWLDLKK